MISEVDSGIRPKVAFNESSQGITSVWRHQERSGWWSTGRSDWSASGKSGKWSSAHLVRDQQGACDMLCSDLKMECFCEGHNASNGLEPREKNHVSGSIKCACFRERVLCSVYTPHITMMVGGRVGVHVDKFWSLSGESLTTPEDR